MRSECESYALANLGSWIASDKDGTVGIWAGLTEQELRGMLK